MNEPNTTERTPEKLAASWLHHVYGVHHYTEINAANEGFLAGHSAATESAKEPIARVVAELEECSRELWNRKEAIDRLTRERDEAREISHEYEDRYFETNALLAEKLAHRACHNQEQDLDNGKLAGYCVVCGVPWPCDYARPERDTLQSDLAKAREERNLFKALYESEVGRKLNEREELQREAKEAREEIARLKFRDDLFKRLDAKRKERATEAKCEIQDLRAELTAARETEAYVRLQRDALLEMTWLDLPDAPCESTRKWAEEFALGWERRSELTAANARAESLIAKHNAEMTEFRRVWNERVKESNVRAEKAERALADDIDAAVNRVCMADTIIQNAFTERDALRQKLADEHMANAGWRKNWEDAQERLENMTEVATGYHKTMCRNEIERDSALSALEATRETINCIVKKQNPCLGNYYYLQDQALKSETIFSSRLTNKLDFALSLSPSTALREHDLKVAEEAWMEGLQIERPFMPESQLHKAWLASDTRAKILGEGTK